MRIVYALALILSLSGCGVYGLTVLAPRPAEPARSYTLGQPTTVNTGDTMVRVRRLYSLPSFTPEAAFDAPAAGVRAAVVPFRPGQVWVAKATDADGNWLLDGPVEANVAPGVALHIARTGEIGRGWIIPGSGRPIQGRFPEGARMMPTEGSALPGSFAAELVYSGRSGNTIRLLYREFSDDLARPAYSQELTYDLSESSDIRFRSIAITISEANSSGITYTVVDDGGLDWLPS